MSINIVDTAELSNPYHFIFVDEAKNFSYAELKTLNNYRRRNPGARIVYSIDQNQQIGSFGLKTNYLAELEPGLENNIFKLSTSYRNGKAIINIANNITQLRNTITGGDLDASFSIQQLQSAEALDSGRVIEIKTESNISYILRLHALVRRY